MQLKTCPKLGWRGNNKTIQRERPKNKMLQWKGHHPSQQYWESIHKNYQWKSEKTGHNHQSTGRWQIRMLHSWPPNNTQTNDPRNKRKRAYCTHNLPRCTKSIWQGEARCNTICLKQQGKSMSETASDKERGRGGTLSDRKCNPDLWNSQRAETKKPRIQNKYHPGLIIVDGRCLPHPPRPGKTARNIRYHQPCGKQIPYSIRSSKMQSYQKRKWEEKSSNAEWRSTRRSPKLQIENIDNKGNLSDQLEEIEKI